MKPQFITFHNGNLNPELLIMQKAVFDHFGFPLQQIKTHLSHPEAIDSWLSNFPWSKVIIFDADCIPLNTDVINEALEHCDKKIISVVQKASHIPNSQIYASPAFMALSKRVFNKLGRPSFKATERGDVAEEISYAARKIKVELVLMWPTHVENPQWPLTDEIKFGNGTTYGGNIYHAFESNANHHSTSRFIEKCREVLGL